MDVNRTAYKIVQCLTSENKEEKVKGRAGGKVGGAMRAAKLSPERRKEIAVAAIKARWAKKSNGTH